MIFTKTVCAWHGVAFITVMRAIDCRIGSSDNILTRRLKILRGQD
jgi:hypothetical protein